MMTAREAMEWAIQSGRSGDIEIGRFWLDVARELREGSAPAGPEVTMPVKAKQTDTQSLCRPDERPGEAITGDGQRCENCGYFLRWTDDRMLVHTRTGLQTCPVGRPGPDDTIVHTFAALDGATEVR